MQTLRFAKLACLAWAATTILLAQPGTLITTIPLSVPGSGVSVAADCQGNIYYTNSDATLHKMDKAGAHISSIPITGLPGTWIDEMAWDDSRKILWGGRHGTNPVDIYRIDPTTGAATFAFTSSTVSAGIYRDGLAWDATDDTLWISGDISTTIEHHTSAGAFIGSITPKNAGGTDLGLISGVVVGVGDQLYLGRNGAVEIVRVKKSDGAWLGSFASPGGTRDEGLECDPTNFSPKLALLSREYNSPGHIDAIEVEAGTCVCGSGVCPRTQGYWKNHSDAWPVTSLTLGTVAYSKAAAIGLLQTPVKGDASLNLAHQLIAAKLNKANGSPVPPAVNAAIASADLLIGANPLPMGVASNTALGKQMVALASTLDQYNNGLLTEGCAGR